MKVALLILLVVALVLAALAVYFTVRAVQSNQGRPRKRKQEWQVVHEEVNGATEVWLVKGTESRGLNHTEFVGRAKRDDDYSDKLLEIDTEADNRAAEWNAAERVSRKRLN